MPVAHMLVELRIPAAQSLKDRRQVVRSLKDRLRRGFNLSVAELDEALLWQSATLGIAAISGSRDYLRGEMTLIEQTITRMASELGAEIADCWWDFLESGEATASDPPQR